MSQLLQFIIALTSSVLIISFSDSTNAAAATIPSELKQVVGFIFVAGKDGKLVPNGTAFFVGVSQPTLEAPKRAFVHLVTAKHVLQSEDKSWLPKVFLRLNTKAGASDYIEIPIILSGEKKTVYLHENDSSVDIAVIPLLPDQKRFEFMFLPDEMITTEKSFRELRIAEGSEIFFSGLFTPYIGTLRNYPIVRFGRVSLITDEKIKFVDKIEANLYLVESASYGGNSGSPVYFSFGPDREPNAYIFGPPVFKLAGVMSGSFLDLQPITVVETSKIAVARSNMGIAAVVPAYKLHEILFGKELTKRRSEGR